MKWETFRNDQTAGEVRLIQKEGESDLDFDIRGSTLMMEGYRSTGLVDTAIVDDVKG
jgi:hypothetical protein